MCRVFHHVLVLTVAFALVASAAAWRQCTGLQLAAAASASTEHGSRAGHHGQVASHGEHGHHAMYAQHQQGTDDPVPPAADDHGCIKCCSMCTVANAVLPVGDTTMVFTISAHVFSGDHKAWSGNTVAVDPGIPKRII